MELLNVCLLTTLCVKLLGLYLPVYTFCCIRASASGLMVGTCESAVCVRIEYESNRPYMTFHELGLLKLGVHFGW